MDVSGGSLATNIIKWTHAYHPFPIYSHLSSCPKDYCLQSKVLPRNPPPPLSFLWLNFWNSHLPLACYNGRTLTDERSARYKQHPEKKIPSRLEWKVLFRRELIAVQCFFLRLSRSSTKPVIDSFNPQNEETEVPRYLAEKVKHTRPNPLLSAVLLIEIVTSHRLFLSRRQ